MNLRFPRVASREKRKNYSAKVSRRFLCIRLLTSLVGGGASGAPAVLGTLACFGQRPSVSSWAGHLLGLKAVF